MFKNLKNFIRETVCSAVLMAETKLETEEGKEKKKFAIEFVTSKIPLVQPFKAIVTAFLSSFIDDAIEQAVAYVKYVKSEQER